MRYFDMARGGSSWSGWTFGKYGRAKEWRLIAPTGETFSPGEVVELRELRLDVDYLRMRVRELEAQLEQQALYFTREQLEALRSAVAILDERLPRVSARRQLKVRKLALVGRPTPGPLEAEPLAYHAATLP